VWYCDSVGCATSVWTLTPAAQLAVIIAATPMMVRYLAFTTISFFNPQSKNSARTRFSHSACSSPFGGSRKWICRLSMQHGPCPPDASDRGAEVDRSIAQ
jgi:hypothetical protein